MASTQQLLFLPERSDAAACLELFRRILQPDSRSLPHITLRYSARPLKESARLLYEDLQVADFVLDRPSTFDSKRVGDGLRTVLLLCDSEELEHVSYRPDFPESIFHLTLYDGPTSLLAQRALERLARWPWGLAFALDLERYPDSKSAVASSSLAPHDGVWLTDRAHSILSSAFDALGYLGSLDSLRDEQKLVLIDYVCQILHDSPDATIVEPTEAHAITRLGEVTELGQLAFWSEEDISSLSPGNHRRRKRLIDRNSTYITPPELSLPVVDEVLKWLGPEEMVDFGDPAIGGGIFYAALRSRLGEERINSARGVEIDVSSARKTLHRWRRSRFSILVGDFLQEAPEPSAWTLVLANPPYRRSQLLARSLDRVRVRLERELDLRISRRSDLYIYFLLRAHAWMSDGALAAWVLPAEFQVTRYGQTLREYLSHQVQLLRIHTYDAYDSQFDNALTSTSVLIFKKVVPDPDVVIEISQGGSLRSPNESRPETAASLADKPRWSFSFLSAERPASGYRYLGQYFEIKRGIATGANSLFVLPTDRVRDLAAEAWVRPIFPRAKNIPGAILRADSDGAPVPSSNLWLIDTDQPLGVIEMSSPRFAGYLRSIEAESQDSFLARRRIPTYSQEVRASPPFAFVYMAKTTVSPDRRFIVNYSRATVLNNYLAMYPRPFVLALMDRDPEMVGAIHRALGDVQIAELVAEGRTYGLGLLKLEPKELARVRLSDSNVWSVLDAEDDVRISPA